MQGATSLWRNLALGAWGLRLKVVHFLANGASSTRYDVILDRPAMASRQQPFEEAPVEESRGVASIPRLFRSVNERYPSASFMGLAFCLAWQRAIAPLVWNGEAPWFGRTRGLPAYSLCSHAVLVMAVVVGVLSGVAWARMGGPGRTNLARSGCRRRDVLFWMPACYGVAAF